MVPVFVSDELRILYEESDLQTDWRGRPEVAERYRFCVYCLGLAPDERAALPMKCLRMSTIDAEKRRYALRLTEEFELITRIEAGHTEVTAVIEHIQRVERSPNG